MARIFGLMTLILAQAVVAQTPPATVSIVWDTNAPAARLAGLSKARLAEFRGLSAEELGRVFQVSVEPANVVAAIGLPPMLGRCSVKENGLEFVPQFPFEPGLAYRAVYQPKGGRAVTSVLRLPKRVLKRETEVAAIYPSAEVLPQNLLKFYVHFSGPMRGGHIYEHIVLTDESGEAVELPFLEIDEELWNPQMTRLTLFLDPGRIKREVKPLEEIGPALFPGKRYTLTIRESWSDARGAPLKAPMKKVFQVVTPDREAPDPANWRIAAPESRSTNALALAFSDPMDQALALRMISVVNGAGEPVPGTKRLGEFERSWMFDPVRPWQAGSYRVLVHSTIEDLAGNNIGKLFEVDLAEGNRPREPVRTVALPFEIR